MDYANSDVLTAATVLNQKIYLVSVLSSQIFKNNFIETFDFVAFFSAKIELYFAGFLFIKFLIEIIVQIIKVLEIIKLTNRIMSFWKLMLGANYNLFVLSILPQSF